MTAVRPAADDREADDKFPSTKVENQDTGEVLLPGTRDYAETARRFRSGALTTAEFLKLLYEALASRMR